MARKVNDAGIKLIKEFEGFSAKAYPDPATKAEPYTIGYGSTYYEDGRKVKLTDPVITEQRAEELMRNVLAKDFVPKIEKLLKVNVTDNQFAAICSFCYNLGIGNFAQSTFLRCINARNWNDAAAAILLWNKAGGRVMPGLVRRREAEKKLFLS